MERRTIDNERNVVKMIKHKASLMGTAPICNECADRAPHIGGKCFILCWRCTMGCTGIILGAFMYAVLGLLLSDYITLWGCLAMMLPMIIDGLIQHYTEYVSNNLKRIATGLLFGLGIISVLAYLDTLLFKSVAN